MYDQDSKGISYMAGFFMLIAFAIAGLTFASMISLSVWTSMTGKDATELVASMTNPAYSHVYKIIQVINEVMGYLIPTVVVAFLLNRQPMKLLGFSTQISARQIGLIIPIVALALLVGNALAYFNDAIPIPADWRIRFDKMELAYNEQAKAVLGLKDLGDYLIALVVMAFIPAVCEETFFRGGMQNLLARGSGKPWLALIIVSLLFSAAHGSYYGFFFRFFLGAVLGLIYQYSGKLWLAILAHFINNALTVTVYYIFTKQGKSVDDVMEATSASWWTILFLPALVGLFLVFKKNSLRERTA